jgi:transposase
MIKPAIHPPTHDAAALQAALVRIAQLEQQTCERDAYIQHILNERDAKQLKIDQLTYELARYKRVQFGKTSEVLSKLQQDLFNETLNEDFAAIASELEQLRDAPVEPRAARANSARPRLPEHLARTVIVHEPETCQCLQCGGDLVKLGEDVSEKLHYTPGTFSVERHIRPKYACKPCERIVTAPVPAAIIDGGMATNSLLAWVVASKYLDHLPLYRIEHIAARHNVHLPRQTQAQWIGKVGVALQPLVDRLSELLRQGSILHADETPVAQLDPGSGKTHRAYAWVYRSAGSDPPIIVFDYQSSRSGQHARAFLANWRGHLMVDDYAGYKAMFNDSVVELGCWAHARRKFHDLHVANGSPIAHEALTRIGALYVIEREAKVLNETERCAIRQEKAAPLLADLHDWLRHTRVKVPTGSATAKAMDYTLKRWPALVRYLESGAFPMDNNPVENAIRPLAVGKKNWLFVGSERAGKRAAAILSLFATAKANGFEPYAWLVDTLDKLPTWKNSKIDELLPIKSQGGGG